MLYGMASAGTVAWVMYQKFCNGLPYYRQEKDWKQYGVEITRATMANWVIRNSEAFFLPMYEYFHRKLLERGFAMADETPLQVLHEPERRAQTKSYMWLFRSGEDGGPPIILYKYSETRAGDNAVDFLHGFKGYLMCDGYSGYNKVPDAKRTACWAHIRRYLTDAIPKGKALDYTQIYRGLQSPKYQEKLRNARLCNNDKSAFYLPRQCLRDGAKALILLGFLDGNVEFTPHLHLWKIGSVFKTYANYKRYVLKIRN